MRKAIDLAEVAEVKGEVPVGALVVRDDDILGEGFNQVISACDPSAHAEIVALRAAARCVGNYRLPGTTLYVTIEPCAMCAGAIVHARIERLVFGAREPRSGAVCSACNLLEEGRFNHRVTWQEGIFAGEAASLLLNFFRMRR